MPHALHGVIDFVGVGVLLRDNGWRVVVLDTTGMGEAGAAVARNHGLEWLGGVGRAGTLPSATQPRGAASWRSRLRAVPILGPLLVSLHVLRSGTALGQRLRRRAAAALDDVRPASVVVLDERSGGLATAVVCEAMRRGIRVVVSASEAMTEDRRCFVDGRRELGWLVRRLGWSERLVGRLLQARGIRVFALSAGERVYWRLPTEVLAEWLSCGTSDDPWVRGATRGVAQIAVSSATYQQAMMRSGVGAERIAVVGYPRHDEIARARAMLPRLRERLEVESGVPRSQPIVLIGLPYFAQTFYPDGETLLSDLLFITKTVREGFPNHAIVFARHPRISPDQLAVVGAPLFAVPGTYLADPLTTYEAIATCDVYVPFYSGTAYGALAAATIVLSYDFLGSRNYDTYLGWSSEALQARSHDEFRRQVARLGDAAFRRERAEIARAGAAKYGFVDGRNHRRLAALIDPTIALSEAA